MSTTYDRAALADRMEAVLGTRPTRSQLDKAPKVAERPIGRGRARLTAGMPAPDPSGRWRADDVEAWLARHPALELQRDIATITAAYANAHSDRERHDIVGAARRRGRTWAQIASAITSAQGRRITRQAVAKHYGHDG